MEPTVVIQPIIFENVKFITKSSSMAKQETDSVIIFNGKYRIPINKSLMIERCTFFKAMLAHIFEERASFHHERFVYRYTMFSVENDHRIGFLLRHCSRSCNEFHIFEYDGLNNDCGLYLLHDRQRGLSAK